MNYLITGKQAKLIDQLTIQQTGIPSLVLMERAALAVAETVEELIGDRKLRDQIIVICGNGNNGGDGIAAARILHQRGFKVSVYFVNENAALSHDAQKQLEIAKKIGVSIVNSWEVDAYNVIIDAMFGIGLTRNLEGKYQRNVEKINQASQLGNKVCAIDIPSGIHSDTGQVMGCCVHADTTVTFGYKKLGMILYPGADYTGEIRCVEIGFDLNAEKVAGVNFVELNREDLYCLPKRRNDSNKGTYGSALIIAGSKNMAGAAYFSAKAAYRMGTGLVYVFTSEYNRGIIHQLLPEAVLKTYDENYFEQAQIAPLLEKAKVIVLGPGLGMSAVSADIVKMTLLEANVPLIIDADAINILAKHPEWMKNCKAKMIFTPHMKELSRLTGYSIQYLKENLVDICEAFSKEFGVICISKDARTMIFDQNAMITVNTTGNNGMSTGGSGDVLTGIIAGLIATGMNAHEASQIGVLIHGLAGDLAAEKLGYRSMIASDIVDAIADVLSR